MLIFYNAPGVIMAGLSILVGLVSILFVGENSGLLSMSIFLVAADLIYRSKRKDPFESTPFFHPKRGGNIMFIPIWIIGSILFVIALSQ